MDQLNDLITARFERVKQIMANPPTAQQMRNLKEQEKMRCEKENWILSMIRLNKNNGMTVKLAYLTASLRIMRVIDPKFTHNDSKHSEKLMDQHFLNQFVNLYRAFFDRYEQQFNFKTKVRTFLRPTNHNVVNDLIKYLSDFSRDYYQQTCFWQIRGNANIDGTLTHKLIRKRESTTSNKQNTESEKQDNTTNFFSQIKKDCDCKPGTSLKSQKHIGQSAIDSIRNGAKIKRSITNISQSGSICNSNFGKIEEIAIIHDPKDINLIGSVAINLKRVDFVRNYDIMNIKELPSISGMEKDRNNPEIIKLRMNQIYRETKYRNTLPKTSCKTYYTSFQQNNQIVSDSISKAVYLQDKASLKMTQPFRISLIVEKNGFSYINVGIDEAKNKRLEYANGYLSPTKDRAGAGNTLDYRSQNGSGISVQFKSDFLFTSLKVLRISQSFLPPLMANNTKISQPTVGFRAGSRLSMESIEISKSKVYGTQQTSATNLAHLRSNSPEKRYSPEHLISSSQNLRESNKEKLRYYNVEPRKEETRDKEDGKRLGKLIKHFTSEEKAKRLKKPDPEDKVKEWLEKIRFMKEIERKKILGF